MSSLKERLLEFFTNLLTLWHLLFPPNRNLFWSLACLYRGKTSQGPGLERTVGKTVLLILLMYWLGRVSWISLAMLKKANNALLQGLFVIRADKSRDSNTCEHKKQTVCQDHFDLFHVRCIKWDISDFARSNYPWASVWVAGGFHCLSLFSGGPWQQQRFPLQLQQDAAVSALWFSPQSSHSWALELSSYPSEKIKKYTKNVIHIWKNIYDLACLPSHNLFTINT